MTCVVDSSVVIAALLEEVGAANAVEAMRNGFISAVNLAEAFTVLQRLGGRAAEVERALHLAGTRTYSFEGDQAKQAGLLETVTRPLGLSLGDRACLALARKLRVDAVTADRAWLRVADAAGVRVRLIR